MAEPLAPVALRKLARGTTGFHPDAEAKQPRQVEYFICSLALLELETDERERYSGFRVRIQAENCLHWVPEVAEFHEDLLRISVRVKPSQNYRQGLDSLRRKGVVLKAVRLEEGLDQAMVLEPADDNLDRITAKQLQVCLLYTSRCV